MLPLQTTADFLSLVSLGKGLVGLPGLHTAPRVGVHQLPPMSYAPRSPVCALTASLFLKADLSLRHWKRAMGRKVLVGRGQGSGILRLGHAGLALVL